MRILDPASRSAAQTRRTGGSIPASGLRQVQAGSYSITDDIATMLCATFRGQVDITLPRAALNAGRTIVIRKTDAGSNMVKVDVSGGEPIAGMSFVSLAEDGEFLQAQSDGKAWQIPLHF